MGDVNRIVGIGSLLCAGLAIVAQTRAAEPVKAGAGTYFTAPKGRDKGLPAAPFRTEAMLKRAAPTSQWYSTLIFNAKPAPIYAQPLTVKPTAEGLEIALAGQGSHGNANAATPKSRYPHREPLLVAPLGFKPGPAKLAGAGDWSIDISMARDADDMRATVARGNPYAFIQRDARRPAVSLPAAGERFGPADDPRVLALRVNGKAYALFAPTGARWESTSPREWIARLPADRRYLSVAALPDDKPETLALLTRHAYAVRRGHARGLALRRRSEPGRDHLHREDARDGRPRPRARFTACIRTTGFDNASVEGKLGPAYDTVRGKIRLLAAPEFKTSYAYTGFVPILARHHGVAAQGRTGRRHEVGPSKRPPHDAARRAECVLAGQGPAAHHEAARCLRAARRHRRPRPGCSNS